MAIGTTVGIAGGNARQGAARRLAHHTKSTEFRHQTFHAIEHGLIQRHVNHLALPTAVPLLQSQQNTDDAVQCGQGIANADPNANWCLPRLATQMTQTAHGLGHHTKTRAIPIRPCLAVSTDAQNNQTGVRGH